MSNHIELFVERVVGLMADRLDERNKANKAKIRAMMIDKGHKAHPYLKGYHKGDPVEDEKALRVSRREKNSKPSPELVAGAAKEKRIRAAEYKFNVGKV